MNQEPKESLPDWQRIDFNLTGPEISDAMDSRGGGTGCGCVGNLQRYGFCSHILVSNSAEPAAGRVDEKLNPVGTHVVC